MRKFYQYRKIVFFILLIFIITAFFGRKIFAAENTSFKETKLYARSAVLMDADSGRVLYGKNENEILPMASTTKILTLILALEYGKMDDTVTASSYAASMPKVHLGMKAGEQYRLEDLLYSLMLESHNDSAVAIAEHLGGSVEGFAKMMNQKARDIGCTESFFITPNGLDASVNVKNKKGVVEKRVHSTTARELAKIMSYCITKSSQKDQFLQITQCDSYQFCNLLEKEDGTRANGSRSFSCNNHNAFLKMMSGAISGKTGFTGNAGYCYVGALKQEDKTLVVALLACGWPNHKSYKWSDTKMLMNYGLEHYHYQSFKKIPLPESILNPIPVAKAQTEKLSEKTEVEVAFVEDKEKNIEGVLLGDEEEVKVICQKEKSLQAPVYKNELVGTVSYLVEGEVWQIKHIVVKNDKKKIDLFWCFQKVTDRFLLKNKLEWN